MADWKIFVTVKKLGVIIPNPSIVFGHIGAFTGDVDGMVEIETEKIPVGAEVIMTMLIKENTTDGRKVIILKRCKDGDNFEIDLHTHGKYVDPSSYIPPSP